MKTPTDPTNAAPDPDPAAVAAALEEWRDLRSRINRFNSHPPELLRAIARNCLYWPTMTGRGQIPAKHQEDLFNEIDLGAAVPLVWHVPKGHGKAPRFDTHINDIAGLSLRMAIDSRACGMTGPEHLPELTLANSKEWIDYCWKELLRMFPEPWNEPIFKKHCNTTKKDKYVREGSTDSQRRRQEITGMKEAIRDAFAKAIRRLIKP